MSTWNLQVNVVVTFIETVEQVCPCWSAWSFQYCDKKSQAWTTCTSSHFKSSWMFYSKPNLHYPVHVYFIWLHITEVDWSICFSMSQLHNQIMLWCRFATVRHGIRRFSLVLGWCILTRSVKLLLLENTLLLGVSWSVGKRIFSHHILL